jgi:DNA (cytosine-5)-methyltransferase 1
LKTAVSLFAGVGGFDLALERAGVKVVASVEIDKKAQDVLRRHFPNSTIFGDISGVTGEQLIQAGFNARGGILTGGFPCQDLSVAGKRAGLAGKRSGLFWEICRLIDETGSETIILENVPGLLSSNNGRDMAVVIEALVKRGYRVGWRVLDAQYFGVPQRRRRVFIVGCLRDSGRTPEEILNISQSRAGFIRSDETAEQDSASDIGEEFDSNYPITFSKARRAQNVNDFETWIPRNYTNTLNLFDNATETRTTELVVYEHFARRLTPLEMERLQGFPDGWTDNQADGRRCNQIGNAVAVPVARWIIDEVVAND